MELIILSGMSGSGKSTVLNILEDFGYYCIDNFPPSMYPSLKNLFLEGVNETNKLAITIDIRSKKMFQAVKDMLEYLHHEDIKTTIFFVDASDSILLKRYKETRRVHPLVDLHEGSIEQSIVEERKELEFLRAESDFLIDTSELKTNDLKNELLTILGNELYGTMQVHFVSFGFKYGILKDADIVFDLRCLKNPYYDPALRSRTGEEEDVREYILVTQEAQDMYKAIEGYLNVAIPLYKAEGRTQLVIGFGCTGGKHRSATFAYSFYNTYEHDGISKIKRHRDILKEK